MGSIFCQSQREWGAQPQFFDDLLMMCQTERLETDGTKYEKSAKYTP